MQSSSASAPRRRGRRAERAGRVVRAVAAVLREWYRRVQTLPVVHKQASRSAVEAVQRVASEPMQQLYRELVKSQPGCCATGLCMHGAVTGAPSGTRRHAAATTPLVKNGCREDRDAALVKALAGGAGVCAVRSSVLRSNINWSKLETSEQTLEWRSVRCICPIRRTSRRYACLMRCEGVAE